MTNDQSKRIVSMVLAFVLGVSIWTSGGFSSGQVQAANGVTLYAPYTNIAVTPGESVHHSVNVINTSGEIQTVPLRVEGLSDDWDTELTAGGWSVEEVSVRGGQEETVSLDLTVPQEIEKGRYTLELVAPNYDTLALTINVTQQGTYTTELTTDQPNMTGHADSDFQYALSLRNRTAEEQLYSLTADASRGWDVVFNVGGESVTSTRVQSNQTQDINVTVTPPQNVQQGTYEIPVKAQAGSSSSQTTLEVVVTGSYDIQLTTPSETFNTDIRAGNEKKVTLVVNNPGSATLRDIQLEAQTPSEWNVAFEPTELNRLEPGQSKETVATIQAADQAITGDYMVNMKASTPEVSTSKNFRVTVKTSLLWGWLGVLIIAAVIAGMYYLFRTYGRR